MQRVAFSFALAACALAHGGGSGHRAGEHMGPLNTALGTHGYPDCAQPRAFKVDDVAANQFSMVCEQRHGAAGALKIGCVGDSITAGAHSSGPTMTYPAQLQAMLDPAKYVVTNLGACGSTMQKGADSPYWQRPQYTTLVNNTWDIIVIMLGTNDAKDKGDGGPANWPAGQCFAADGSVTLAGCRFATDYAAMIEVVRGLGTTPGVPPAIYVAVPPPLMQHGSIGANQTVINSIYPQLLPLIGVNNTLGTVPINVYASMGGVPNWSIFPPGCVTPNSPWPACPWWCDAQSCDQVRGHAARACARPLLGTVDGGGWWIPQPRLPGPHSPHPPPSLSRIRCQASGLCGLTAASLWPHTTTSPPSPAQCPHLAQCHPNDQGYRQLALTMKIGLGLGQ